jgi:hypothetical protein
MTIHIDVVVKIAPYERKTIVITEDDLLKLAEQKAEDDWFCHPKAQAETVCVHISE